MDFFSGAGGMSCGFARREGFQALAAVDAEMAKPCEGFGKLSCNETYAANIGIGPINRNIAEFEVDDFQAAIESSRGKPLARGELDVFICCPPCTDFSRAKPQNHLVDSPKNSLVVKCADFIDALRPEFVLMENARELIRGNHTHHYQGFKARLEKLGYQVEGGTHFLTRFGLPQVRERALVVASRSCGVKTLEDLWQGWTVSPEAITVRHAIGDLNDRPLSAGEVDPEDPMHASPCFASEDVRRRMEAIPRDGGSWFDLAGHPDADTLLTKSMLNRVKLRDFGSHPDVYGRMAWDKPAPTIKRECAHVGNGRYCHPEQTRLLTVREMAILQGFPNDYRFESDSLANRYRHIGDAVPPMISYQLSALVEWMRTGRKPDPHEWILAGTSLRIEDIRPNRKLVAATLF